MHRVRANTSTERIYIAKNMFRRECVRIRSTHPPPSAVRAQPHHHQPWQALFSRRARVAQVKRSQRHPPGAIRRSGVE